MVSLREDGKQEDICPICQEDLKKAVSTDCRHLFCQTCLAQHLEKASSSGFLCCPVCRKPCSEGVLGMGYICLTHQKRVRSFCEESRLLLCEECEKSPEHKSHHEVTIEEGISHYKERLSRKIRKVKKALGDLTRKHPQSSAQEEEKQQAVQFQVDCGTHRLEAELDNQHQARRRPDAFSQQWPDQPEDIPTEASSSLKAHLCSLLTDLEWMVKNLDASKLKDASDLLDRHSRHF
ncbi:E3 ubiquitin ligase TRIM40 [Talpa occidentalis]|uniref:E3 ubiquitin ligase TRIM40 n=1 Tax=Talpa occidentalis TaxID=50954 RepID=UPI0023F928FE|nr:E3 ubiquitin ligase TRIM40 [Talpa occidentalis]